MNNLLNQLMTMFGSSQVGKSTASNTQTNHAVTQYYNGGQGFQINANQMPRYNPNLPSGAAHLPSQSQGCFLCVATKNIFGSILGGIR